MASLINLSIAISVLDNISDVAKLLLSADVDCVPIPVSCDGYCVVIVSLFLPLVCLTAVSSKLGYHRDG